MKCNNCGNPDAYRWRATEHGEQCDSCGGLSSVAIPDVFFQQPYVDPHLIDTKDPRQKDGVLISSRREKDAIMRRMGVHELGDRVRGARNEDRFAIRRERERSR